MWDPWSAALSMVDSMYDGLLMSMPRGDMWTKMDKMAIMWMDLGLTWQWKELWKSDSGDWS